MQKRLSVPKCRKLLKPPLRQASEEEILKLRDRIYDVVTGLLALYEAYKEPPKPMRGAFSFQKACEYIFTDGYIADLAMERAAIMEMDGRVPRAFAESEAIRLCEPFDAEIEHCEEQELAAEEHEYSLIRERALRLSTVEFPPQNKSKT